MIGVVDTRIRIAISQRHQFHLPHRGSSLGPNQLSLVARGDATDNKESSARDVPHNEPVLDAGQQLINRFGGY